MTRSLLVSKKYINNYLNFVWLSLKEKHGKFGTMQFIYDDSLNSDLYYYDVSFSFHRYELELSVVFHISKTKGVFGIDFTPKNSQANSVSNNILDIFMSAPKDDGLNQYIKVGQFKVMVSTRITIGGNYTFPKSGFSIEDHSIDGFFYLVFNLSYIQPEEISKKAAKKADEILSALSIFIYDYFSIKQDCPVINDAVQLSTYEGVYIDKQNFMELDEISIGNKICMLSNSDELLSTVLNSPARLKSARLFREGLYFRRKYTESIPKLEIIKVESLEEMIREPMDSAYPNIVYDEINDFAKKYEIISYVGSIESLLSNKSITTITKCKACNADIVNKISGITKKFNAFVDRNANENHGLRDLFKRIYKERSQFLHAGYNITPPPNYNIGLPLDLSNRELEFGYPQYYHNLIYWVGYLLRSDIINEIK
ncbi:TPA: hypothetical protein L9U43_004943 [Klebsiella pneumoniae]|nr:hypothetical protein [Klebsiella pneumoniae]EIX9273058.1 hypothetical protein [Klebsiella pneumoniae]EKZ6340795.1 hypothetical protein [Klebsiella pneumoniae]EKZ6345786.1 hypothetical protein [Klebsiella pneumoniae]ELN4457082.1 hypothetical protein [Klebsiella pneumoniae]ELN4504627.1 hypothetical protein [Klebsiella pneumoniae]